MSLKNFDYISPKITLYFYGTRRHTSKFGGTLTILMVLLSATYVFYLIYNIIRHKISNLLLYRTYLVDAGQFYFNDTTGIFHYFQLYDFKTREYEEYNSKYIRIFMSRLYRTYINEHDSLSENEHWVYGKCREGEDNKNINKNIFSEESYFYKGACLRYYYNNEENQYYSIDDKNNFKSPYLIKGSGTPGNLFLETIVEKCDNSSFINKILGPCGPEKEINNYLDNYKGVFLQLLEK